MVKCFCAIFKTVHIIKLVTDNYCVDGKHCAQYACFYCTPSNPSGQYVCPITCKNPTCVGKAILVKHCSVN